MNIEQVKLSSPAPGTSRYLQVCHFRGQQSESRSAFRKAYIQAGLHADEWPGLLVVQHLLPMLDKAQTLGLLQGELVVVPYANPIGLAQNIFGYLAGRFDFAGTGNFNRNFGDLYLSARRLLEGALGTDIHENTATVKSALRQAVAELAVEDDVAALKKTLLSLSIDADFIYDLHCDDRTSAHVYAVSYQQQAAENLCRRLQFDYLFLEEMEGAVAFDGAHLQPWHWLQKDFPDAPLRPPELAVTIEYRGQTDVEDELARADARNLYLHLVDSGFIRDDPQPLLNNWVNISPLEAVDVVKAEVAGLLVFSHKLNARLKKGEVFAEIVLLDARQANQRVPVVASTDGWLMGLSHRRLVRPGSQIAKIAGKTPLPHRISGNLLQL